MTDNSCGSRWIYPSLLIIHRPIYLPNDWDTDSLANYWKKKTVPYRAAQIIHELAHGRTKKAECRLQANMA